MSNMRAGIVQLGSVMNELSGSDRNFAESLYNFFQTKGRLSDKQASFIPKLLEKAEANHKRRTQPVTEAVCTRSAKIDNFERILTIFDTAKEKGYKKKIILRFGDKDTPVKLSEAPATGRNAGSVYVAVGEDYKGKIDRSGHWQVSGAKDDKLMNLLSEFVMDPLTIAKKYGFSTGRCACCGKHLTDPQNIAAGVGPICAERFFS